MEPNIKIDLNLFTAGVQRGEETPSPKCDSSQHVALIPQAQRKSSNHVTFDLPSTTPCGDEQISNLVDATAKERKRRTFPGNEQKIIEEFAQRKPRQVVPLVGQSGRHQDINKQCDSGDLLSEDSQVFENTVVHGFFKSRFDSNRLREGFVIESNLKHPAKNGIQTVDPLQQLSVLGQADLEYKIQNQIFTPIDKSEIVQTLNHPCKPGHSIIVRFVNANVVNAQVRDNINCMPDWRKDLIRHHGGIMNCLTCNGQLYMQDAAMRKLIETTTQVNCGNKQCGRKINLENEQVYFCDQCVEKHFCNECVTQHFVFSNLANQTEQHAYYVNYNIGGVGQQTRAKLPKILRNDMSLTGPEYHNNQNPQFVENTSNEVLNTTTYASIAFYKVEGGHQLTYDCYDEVIVPHPRGLSREEQALKLKEFVFASDDGKSLFWFSDQERQASTLADDSSLMENKEEEPELLFSRVDVSREHLSEVSSSPVTGKLKELLKKIFEPSQAKDKENLLKMPPFRLLDQHTLQLSEVSHLKHSTHALHLFDWATSKYVTEPLKDGKVVAKLNFPDPGMLWYVSMTREKLLFQEKENPSNILPQNLHVTISQKMSNYNIVRAGTMKPRPPMVQSDVEIALEGNENYYQFYLTRYDIKNKFVESHFTLFGSLYDVNLDVRVHNEGERVSLLCKGEKWFCFQLDRESGEASQIFNDRFEQHIRDAEFVENNLNRRVCICGRLASLNRQRSHLSDQYTMSYIDLERQINSEKKKKSDWVECLLELVMENKRLQMRISNQQSVTDVRLQKMMPFSFSGGNLYRAQLVFYDQAYGRVSLYHITAELTPLKDDRRVEMPPVRHHKFEYSINHPILLYKPQEPKQNILMLVNLHKNIPQKRLILEDLKFLCFVKCANNVVSKIERDPSSIRLNFLARIVSSKKIILMSLKIDPWNDMEDSKFFLQQQRFSNIDFGSHIPNDIKAAALFCKRCNTSGEITRVLIVQLPQQILVFQGQEEQEVIPLIKSPNATMAPIQMVVRQDRAYYVLRQPHGDEIICLKIDPVTNCFTQTQDFLTKDRILQLQAYSLTENQIENKEQSGLGRLLFLDAAYTMYMLRYDDQKKHTDHVRLKEVSKVDLSNLKMKRVFRALELIGWTNTVLSSSAIQCCRQHIVQDQKHELRIQRDCVVYSTQNVLYHTKRYYNCLVNKDEKQNIDIQVIGGCGRIAQVIEEGTMNYFMTGSNCQSRTVELLKQRQVIDLQVQYFLIREFIVVFMQVTKKYLLFDQMTLVLLNIFQGDSLKLFEDCSIDSYYLQMTIDRKVSIVDVKNYNTQPEVLFDAEDLIVSKQLKSRKLFYCLNNSKSRMRRSNSPTKLPLHIDDSETHGRYQQNYRNQCIYGGELYQLYEIQQQEAQEVDDSDWRQDCKFYCLEASQSDDYNFASKKTFAISKLKSYRKIHKYYFHFSNRKTHKLDVDFIVTRSKLVLIIHKTLKTSNNYIFIFDKADIKSFDPNNFRSLEDFNLTKKVQEIKLIDYFYGLETQSKGMAVKAVQEKDLRILLNNYRDKDGNIVEAIQISFFDVALVWNLNTNSEIQSLYKISEFTSADKAYVQTGFRLHRGQHQFYHSNQENTLIASVSTEKHFATVFRQYSQMEIYFLQRIDQMFKTPNKQIIEEVQRFSEPYVLTSCIYGHTFFSLFCHSSQFMEMVSQRLLDITDHELESFKKSQFRQIQRRLFYLICLPYKDSNKSEQPASQGQPSQLQRVLSRQLTRLRTKSPQDSDHHLERARDLKRYISFPYTSELGFQQPEPCNLIQYLIKKKHDRSFDQIIKLILGCPDLSLRSLIQSFDDFKSVFQIQSEAVDAFMNEAMITTPMANQVTHLDWVQNEEHVVFTSQVSSLSKRQIELKAAEAQDAQVDKVRVKGTSISKIMKSLFVRDNPRFRTPVRVEIIQVSWLNYKIKEFYQYLSYENRQNIFENSLIQVLLKQQNYTRQIMWLTFFPYIVYMVSTLAYFVFIVPEPNNESGYFNSDNTIHLVLRLIIMLLSIYLLAVEIGQMLVMRLEYWFDKWNYLNLSVVLVNQFIIVEHASQLFGVDRDHLINLTSVACIQLWLSFYYLLRLFPSMAFYVYLVNAVLYDLRYFLFFYCMTIIMFTTAMSTIDHWYQSRANLDPDLFEYTPITRGYFESIFLRQLMAEWMLGFGEFDVENYSKNGKNPFEWIYFVMASFFTNIVYLNMLIAIMQSTFEKVSEQKDRKALIERTKVYADFIYVLKTNPQLDKEKYLYILTPLYQNDDDNDASWDGGYNRISHQLRQTSESLVARLDSQEKRLVDQNRHLKEQVGVVSEKQRMMLSQMQQHDTEVKEGGGSDFALLLEEVRKCRAVMETRFSAQEALIAELRSKVDLLELK